jgi:hypothetical protein
MRHLLIALRARAPSASIEVVCSDAIEHRRRVENRHPDIPGHTLPTWPTVADLTYECWNEPRLVLDTARSSLADAAAERAIAYVGCGAKADQK